MKKGKVKCEVSADAGGSKVARREVAGGVGFVWVFWQSSRDSEGSRILQ